jgi:hypothetical protein
MGRTLECTSARHAVGECEIVTVLRRRLERQTAMTLRACERVYLAHEVLANLAEGKAMPRPEALPAILQKNDYSCATACLQVLAKYHYGRSRAVLDLSNPIRGTDPAALESAIRAGGRWHVKAGATFVSDLSHYAYTHRPAICLVTPPGFEDSHYVVASGVWRGRVYYHDPLTGPESMLASDWEAAWFGIGQYVPYRRWSIAAWPME